MRVEAILGHSIESYAALWEMVEDPADQEFPRSVGYRPKPEENTHNAWFIPVSSVSRLRMKWKWCRYWKCSVKGRGSGILAGKRVAVKDNVMVAGVPAMNGSKALEGFVPRTDATIVTRILRCGGEIVGKSTCEDLCLSGGSYVTTYGPVRNPVNKDYSAGGSSSGSGVLVGLGEVDLAIGGDQGGSIRIPASACGIVGLKPTWGLVPFTGVMPIETTIDHAGPMARSVADCALFLEAIAGFDDNRDSRQPSCGFSCPKYSEEIKKPLGSGLRLGLLKEGFAACTPEVLAVANAAVDALRASNRFAAIDQVSVPTHDDGAHIWSVIALQGTPAQMMNGAMSGMGQSGDLSWEVSEKLWQGLQAHGPALSHNVKFINMLGTYVHENYGPAIYAKAQKLALALRRKYDEVLRNYDAILMPTLPELPCKLPDKDTPLPDAIGNSLAPIKNTENFDFTHHPALTLNAGFSKAPRLPVGLMLVGKHWMEAELLRISAAVEDILKPLQT